MYSPVFRIVLCAFFLSLAACVKSMPPLDYKPGAAVETLSSAVSLSVQTSDRSMGGHGYIVFRRPDQVHLVILSPFGTTLMEVFAAGERITLVYPSQMTAFTGRFDELPEKGGGQGWRMMRWVMDADPPGGATRDGGVERMGRQGFAESVTFRNGLVVSKTNPAGEQVYYEDYAVINGVPIAREVDMRNSAEDRIRLKLDDPEVNTPVDADAFTPRLDGMTILPLAALQGL